MANILLVEDYPNLQKVYDSVLTLAGHTVVKAADGNEALQKANQTKFDLILLDLMLPNMDGMEFLRLYDLKKHPEVKVVVFTNAGDIQIVKDAKELGAAQVITKPNHTPKQVVAIIEQILGQSNDNSEKPAPNEVK